MSSDSLRLSVETGFSLKPLDQAVGLCVGNVAVAELVGRILPTETGVCIQSHPLGCEDGFVSWFRDTQVVLLSGSLLTTSSFSGDSKKEESIRNRFPASQFVGKFGCSGWADVPQSMFGEKEKPSPCKVFLEGGNVQFVHFQERKIALVGASNLIYSTEQSPCGQMQSVISKMAHALEVPAEHMVFLAHRDLHTDLEALPGFGGVIFLHDPFQALAVLNLAQQKCDSVFLRSNEQRFNLERRMLESQRKDGIFEFNKHALEAIGFNVVGIPGYFKFGYRELVGFLNGLLARDPQTGQQIFITNSIITGKLKQSQDGNQIFACESLGPHYLAEAFSSEMKKHGISVVFVNCFGCSGGGIHCLTREERRDWTFAVAQCIPIDARHLPPRIATILSITSNLDNGCQILLSVRDEKEPNAEIQSISFKGDGNCVRMFDVPLTSHKIFWMTVSTLTRKRKSPEKMLLPGHPCVFNLSSEEIDSWEVS